MKVDRGDELCPDCATRPIEVRWRGLCRPCHSQRLAAARRDTLAKMEAQRELWTARQHVQRMRDEMQEELATLAGIDHDTIAGGNATRRPLRAGTSLVGLWPEACEAPQRARATTRQALRFASKARLLSPRRQLARE